jgi:hypothetical protein
VGEWRRLHDEKLYKMYTKLNIIRVIKSRRMRGSWHVACMGQMRNEYKILVGKPERKRPLVRPRHRWEDNIRINLRAVRQEGMDCIHLDQGRDQWQSLLNTVMNLWVA